jgi:hypothetical protein
VGDYSTLRTKSYCASPYRFSFHRRLSVSFDNDEETKERAGYRKPLLYKDSPPRKGSSVARHSN